MHTADLRIIAVDLSFYDETLATPLHLSKGTITAITYAKTSLTARTRGGNEVEGTGSILLSDVWAYPSPDFSHAQKDSAMRALCHVIAGWLPQDDWGDPLEKGMRLEEELDSLAHELARQSSEQSLDGSPTGTKDAIDAAIFRQMPRLAMLICMAPFDAALHDAWGKANRAPVYECYTEALLNADLSAYLGPTFANRYPNDYLVPKRHTLQVQHVVGVGDPLTPAEAGSSDAAAHPTNLADWIRWDGVTCFKLKTKAQDATTDAQRLIDVYTVAQETLTEVGQANAAIHLSIDPNEACTDPDILVEMLTRLRMSAPHVLDALDYIEQPTPRDLSAYDFTLHDVAEKVPVIIDESLDSLHVLPGLIAQGWSGLSVKTCKGHTHSLLAYCWARQQDLYVTVQDLTNVGLALVHSANLCAHLHLPVNYFECNQRQYLPHARPEERQAYPEPFAVQNGFIHLSNHRHPGLYQ